MIKLEDLVNVPELGLSVRVPGGASPSWVRWVHILRSFGEIGELHGDELVLADDEGRRALPADDRVVGALVLHGAAALGFVPREPGGVPADLVTACRRRELPLIEIPPSATCEAVAMATADLIHGGRAPGLSQLIRREHSLTGVLGSRGGLKAVLNALNAEYGVRMWLLTGAGVAFASDTRSPPEADVRAILAATGQYRGAFDVQIESGPRAWVFPVRHRARHAAHLVCEVPSDGHSPELRLALEQGLSFVKAALGMLHAARAGRRPSEEEFMGRVGAGQATPEEVRAWGRALGFHPHGRLTCVLVRATTTGRRGLSDIGHALRDLADSLELSHVVVAERQEVRAFIFQQDTSNAAIEDALARTMSLLAPRLALLGASVGTSSVVADDVGDFARLLLDARQVCSLNSLREGGPGARAEQSLSAQLLARDDRSLSVLHDAVLAPLVAYDRANGSDLVRTLHVFLSTCGQWNTSAARLKIHVNTLRYRLGRVEKLTGRSLSSMSDRVDFYLAIRTGAPLATENA